MEPDILEVHLRKQFTWRRHIMYVLAVDGPDRRRERKTMAMAQAVQIRLD